MPPKGSKKGDGSANKRLTDKTTIKNEDALAHRRNLANMLTCLNRDQKSGVDGAAKAKIAYSKLTTTPERKEFLANFLQTSSLGGAKKWAFVLKMDHSTDDQVQGQKHIPLQKHTPRIAISG